MKAFTQHTGVVAPMIMDNVDTDQIIPSREMKRVSKLGLGEGLFAGWRYQYDGLEKTALIDEFVLNQSKYLNTSIILGGKNWGCGSSREHAVWALSDYGIRVIIAESFGRIFHINCARNGLLAIELTAESIQEIARQLASDPQKSQLTVDLEQSSIEMPSKKVFHFVVSEADQNMLINGLDYIEFTMRHEHKISQFVERDQHKRSWAHMTR